MTQYKKMITASFCVKSCKSNASC